MSLHRVSVVSANFWGVRQEAHLIDDKDRQIIAVLQANGRISNQDLAEAVNLSPSPCLRRTRILERDGVIRGYTAVIDEQAYGLPVMAFVRIKLQIHSEQSVAAFEAAIQAIDAVLDCYVMTGSSDYLLRVVVGSLNDYEHFIRSRIHPIPGVASIDTSFAYGNVKRSTVLPVPRKP